jgi:hypothetical protein
MPRYTVITLVDITRTNPNRNETDSVKLSQQANFNSLIQAIGLRSNVEWDCDPIKSEGALPLPFDGRGVYWTWDFTVEREDVFTANNDPTGLLVTDLHNVPVNVNLEESINIHPPAFQTQGKQQNTHLTIKV